MLRVEDLSDQNPYKKLQTWERICKIASEGPSGFTSFIRSRFQSNNPDFGLVEELIRKSIDGLPKEATDNSNPSGQVKVDGYLAKGFESTALVCTIGSTQWVAKIGHSRGFASGLLSPSSDEYAQMQHWNYAVLERVYSPNLPQLLPRPYFIFSPEQLGYPSTVQLTPFIEKVTNIRGLTIEQNYNLWREKMLFAFLSQELLAQYNVLPDLVKPGNLQVGLIGSEPHLALLDIGLFNFLAPTPILNVLGYSAFRLNTLKYKIPELCL